LLKKINALHQGEGPRSAGCWIIR